MRAWTFWIRSDLHELCRDYMDNEKLTEMRRAPGNLRATAIYRDLGDGTTEVVVASLWDSMENIKAYVGDSFLKPVIDPHQKIQMIDRDTIVRHYSIDAMDSNLFERALGSAPQAL